MRPRSASTISPPPPLALSPTLSASARGEEKEDMSRRSSASISYMNKLDSNPSTTVFSCISLSLSSPFSSS
jgi:hypothetical protein